MANWSIARFWSNHKESKTCANAIALKLYFHLLGGKEAMRRNAEKNTIRPVSANGSAASCSYHSTTKQDRNAHASVGSLIWTVFWTAHRSRFCLNFRCYSMCAVRHLGSPCISPLVTCHPVKEPGSLWNSHLYFANKVHRRWDVP